ncbi:MAG: M17 family peptidase N-terminal domain-containing protein, partial [Patescibacteria group bacterium]
MKILFTAPRGAAEVSLVAGETIKVIEDQKGNAILKIGLGKPDEADRRKLFSIARKVVKTAKEHKLSSLSVSFKDFQFSKTKDITDRELGRILAENFLMADYDFTRYKSPPKEGFPSVHTLHVTGATEEAKAGFAEGEIIATEVNRCRDLANTPGGDMTPSILADAAKHQLKGLGVSVTVLDQAEIKRLKMGLILGVAKGSAEEPKFIIAEYWGAGKSAKDAPIVLIGKGITFDTGGINLKPTDALLGMNQDMSGGAAVIAAVAAAARLKLKKNIVALVPAVENAVSG